MTREMKTGLMVAAVIHFVAIAGIPGMANPVYEVVVSPSSLEVSLVASRPQPKKMEMKPAPLLEPDQAAIKMEVSEEKTEETIEKKLEPEKKKLEEVIQNQLRGALSEARPATQQNDPPHYPRLARQRGYEGRVVLRVTVSAEGKAKKVEILKPSGHKILDEAAEKTIQTWTFEPAKRFGIAVQSVIDIPVNFRLIDLKN